MPSRSLRPRFFVPMLVLVLGCVGVPTPEAPAPATQRCANAATLPFDPGACRVWNDPVRATATLAAGAPTHGARGAVGPAAAAARLEVLLAYGDFPATTLDQYEPLAGERATVWIEACDGWHPVANLTTDEDGLARAWLPTTDFTPGNHRGWVVVDGDHSAAPFTLLVLPEDEVDAIVTDIDATLTVADTEALQPDPRAIPWAVTAFTELAAKGYAIFYMTARGLGAAGGTYRWLIATGFPLGVLQTAVAFNNAGDPASYKTASLAAWSRLGVDFLYAFGNAPTDLDAYFAAGLTEATVFSLNEAVTDPRATTPVTTVPTDAGGDYARFVAERLPSLPEATAPLPEACPN